MRYLLCLIEQGLVSLLNIGLTIWLIRIGGADLFGVFAFWFNVSLLAGSVQYGLAICHLTPLPPGPGVMPQRLATERAVLAASLAVVAASAVLVAVAVAFGAGVSTIGIPAAIAMVPAYLAYQFARALAFSRGALITATLATTATVVFIAGGLAVAEAAPQPISANEILLIAAVAYGMVGAATTWWLARGLDLRLRHLRDYAPYAAISRWSLLGIVCFETMNRAPGFAVTFWSGAGALGRMSTTQLPSRPPIIAVAALLPALRNTLAEQRDRGDWGVFAAHTRRACIAAALANAVWAVPIGLTWPLLSRVAFGGRFADDVALGLLWTASQCFGSVAAVVAIAFQVCGAFRRIGYADIAGAGATLAGIVLLLPPFGLAGVIVATIVGQAFYLAVVIGQWRFLRETFARRVGHEPAQAALIGPVGA